MGPKETQPAITTTLLRRLSVNVTHLQGLLPYPVLSTNETPSLSDSEAISTFAAGHANFMCVFVRSEQTPHGGENSSGPEEEDSCTKIGELLREVKAILKKRRVLVGDYVVMRSIDWVNRRGVIENVFQRSSEIPDSRIANVRHLLLLFSKEQPAIEPFMIIRFSVDEEFTSRLL